MARRRTLSWRNKLFSLLLIFSIAPMVLLSYWSLRGMEQTSRETTLDGLGALAGAKAEALDQFIDYRKEDVERIATLMAPLLGKLERARAMDPSPGPGPEELPDLEDAEELEKPARDRGSSPRPKGADGERPKRAPPAPAPPATPIERVQADLEASDPAIAAELTEVRQTLGLVLWDQQVFEELLVIDAEGRVVASTFDGHEGKSAADLEYFKNGQKATYLQPVFVSPITKQLTMVIATPIRDHNLQQIGVVAARLNLKRFFRLINDRTGLGESGETVVAKKIKDNVVFMAPTRHDSDAALTREVEIGSERARGLQEAARGQAGSGEQIDYRGKETLAAWKNVPSLEWGVLVKVDLDEAIEDAAAARNYTLALGLGIIGLVVLASVLASRALVQPLRDLKVATDRISRGDFAVELDIRSNDEIGELADSFERMVAAIKFFREYSRPEEEEDEELGPPDDSPRASDVSREG